MAKKTSPNDRESSVLVISKSDFKDAIEERIAQGEELLKRNVQTVDDLEELKSQYSLWNDYNRELLKQSFNQPENEYQKTYEGAGAWLGFTLNQVPPAQQLKDFIEKFKRKIEELRKLTLKVNLLKSIEPEPEVKKSAKKDLDKSQVFIVHGHDDLAKVETARFIENLGFQPIILHEQPSSGQTIIEKIESYSNVGFGIVLYTQCDVGAKNGHEHELKHRARQNVVFEHGYLIANIGRNNVAALVKGEVETPNDISGVVYISMIGDWKLELAKELRNSGYAVDMNKVI